MSSPPSFQQSFKKIIVQYISNVLLLAAAAVFCGIAVPKLTDYIDLTLPNKYMLIVIVAAVGILLALTVGLIITICRTMNKGFDEIAEDDASDSQKNSANSGESKAALILLLTFFFALNGFLFGRVYFQYEMLKKTYDTVEATVSEVETDTITTAGIFGRTNEKAVSQYKFAYDVDGRTYTGRSHAERLLHDGDTITIFILPDDPTTTAEPWSAETEWLFGAITLIIPMVWIMLVAAILSKKKKSANS